MGLVYKEEDTVEKVRTGELAGNVNNRRKQKIDYSNMLHKRGSVPY